MKERNELLDFMKGIAILLVILNHNIPMSILDKSLYFYHIGQAVPIFMVISGYLAYSKYSSSNPMAMYNNFHKIIKRIMIPFSLVTLLQICLKIILGNFDFKALLISGGIGPGSYYPWIFIQSVLITPLILIIIRKYTSIYIGGFIIVGISILLNVCCCIFNLPEYIYRLLNIRYLMYIYIGCIWKKEGIKLNIKTILLIIVSTLFVWIQKYQNVNFSPFFYNSWQGYNWLGAFYTLGIIYIICKLYSIINIVKLKKYVSVLGQYSYEIFLAQMFIFSFINLQIFPFFNNKVLKFGLYIIVTTILPIVLVIVWKKCYKLIISKKSSVY